MIQMRSAKASGKGWVRILSIVLALAASVAPFASGVAPALGAGVIDFKAVPTPLVPIPVVPVPSPAPRVLNFLKAADPTPLSQRQVFTIINNQAARIDDQVAAQLGPRLALTGEIMPGAVAKTISTPPLLAARFPNVRDLTVLPTRYTATVMNGQRAISFNVALKVLDDLHYDGPSKLFLAHIFALLIDPANPNDTSELAVELPVFFEAQNAQSTSVKFRRLHDGQNVELKVSSPTDPYSVRAVTAFDQNQDPINLRINRPTIEIYPAKPSIRGFGLETVPINISVNGAGSLNGEVIGLRTTGGTLKPSSVTLAGSSATATLLSGMLCSATITGRNVDFDDGPGPL
jgi:hypothetical protein